MRWIIKVIAIVFFAAVGLGLGLMVSGAGMVFIPAFQENFNAPQTDAFFYVTNIIGIVAGVLVGSRFGRKAHA